MRSWLSPVSAAVIPVVMLQTSSASSGVDAVRQALLDHETGDGTTIAEVLEAAETARPREFHVGPAASKGSSVTISYWIGFKREPSRLHSNIAYLATASGGSFTFAPIHSSEGSKSGADALDDGLASFLRWVDGEYTRNCRDSSTTRRHC